MASLAPGTVLGGRYEVVRELNRGGTAVVYAATDSASGRAVALKVLAAGSRVPASAIKREISVAASLQGCPYVVQLLDFFAEGQDQAVLVVSDIHACGVRRLSASSAGRLWGQACGCPVHCRRRCWPLPIPPPACVLPVHAATPAPPTSQWELVEGPDLLDLLNEHGGRMQEPAAAHYFAQLVRGVQYLHQRELCHRDLKPENVLVSGLQRLVMGAGAFLSSTQPLLGVCLCPAASAPQRATASPGRPAQWSPSPGGALQRAAAHH